MKTYTMADLAAAKKVAIAGVELLAEICESIDERLRKSRAHNFELVEYKHKVNGALQLLNWKKFAEYTEQLDAEATYHIDCLNKDA